MSNKRSFDECDECDEIEPNPMVPMNKKRNVNGVEGTALPWLQFEQLMVGTAVTYSYAPDHGRTWKATIGSISDNYLGVKTAILKDDYGGETVVINEERLRLEYYKVYLQD